MNWKAPITMSVLVVLLVGAAYYGWQSVVSPSEAGSGTTPTTTAAPHCDSGQKVRKGKRIDSTEVLVNVYNGGSVAGLATTTLTALERKGFRPGVADNAPPGASATNVTILTKHRGDPQVRLVAQQFKGNVAYSHDNLRAGVDVVVGDQFQSVNPAAKRFLVLKRVVNTCKRGGS